MAEPSSTQGTITFRPMTPKDIPFGMRLSLAAGWNQTADDWGMLLEQSTSGSFVACLDGVEAGTVTTVSYQDRFHWIGMVLVDEQFRRLGIGKALLTAAIQAVKGQGLVCLDATPAGKKLYDTLGFKDVYGLGRWLRGPSPLEINPAYECPSLTQVMLPALLEYDLPVFGADRSAVLASLLHRAPTLAFYVERGSRLAGYCLGRYGSSYAQIGPVAANSLEIAQTLFLSALKACAQQEVIVDTTFHLPGWNRLLLDLGFREQRPFIRMSLGTFIPPAQHARQMAIAGPEIG